MKPRDEQNRPQRSANRRAPLFNDKMPGTIVPASALSEPKLPPWVGE